MAYGQDKATCSLVSRDADLDLAEELANEICAELDTSESPVAAVGEEASDERVWVVSISRADEEIRIYLQLRENDVKRQSASGRYADIDSARSQIPDLLASLDTADITRETTGVGADPWDGRFELGAGVLVVAPASAFGFGVTIAGYGVYESVFYLGGGLEYTDSTGDRVGTSGSLYLQSGWVMTKTREISLIAIGGIGVGLVNTGLGTFGPIDPSEPSGLGGGFEFRVALMARLLPDSWGNWLVTLKWRIPTYEVYRTEFSAAFGSRERSFYMTPVVLEIGASF